MTIADYPLFRDPAVFDDQGRIQPQPFEANEYGVACIHCGAAASAKLAYGPKGMLHTK